MQNSLGGQKSPDQFPCAGFYQNSRQMIAHILRKSHLNNPTVPFGTVPLALREGDRSMFSANRLFAEHIYSPKNGPVPGRGVNGYVAQRQSSECPSRA